MYETAINVGFFLSAVIAPMYVVPGATSAGTNTDY